MWLGNWLKSGSFKSFSGSKNDFISSRRSLDFGRGFGPSVVICPFLIGKMSSVVTLGAVISVSMEWLDLSLSGPVFLVSVSGPFSSDTWSPTLKPILSMSFTSMSRCVSSGLAGIEEDEVDGVLRVILLMEMSSQRIERLLGLYKTKVGRGTLIDEIDGIRL